MIGKIFRKFKTILNLPSDTWLMIISHLPGPFGYKWRYVYWKKRLKYLGKNVKIDTGVYFQNPQYISVDDNCWIDVNVIILAGIDKSKREKIILKNKHFKGNPGEVYIGKNVHVGMGSILSGISSGLYISDDCGWGPGAKFYTFCNHYRSKEEPSNTNKGKGSGTPHEEQCIFEGPIYLAHNVGMSVNVTIFPGVYIPENCGLVNNSTFYYGKQYEPNSLLAGNPAQKIGYRYKPKE